MAFICLLYCFALTDSHHQSSVPHTRLPYIEKVFNGDNCYFAPVSLDLWYHTSQLKDTVPVYAGAMHGFKNPLHFSAVLLNSGMFLFSSAGNYSACLRRIFRAPCHTRNIIFPFHYFW